MNFNSLTEEIYSGINFQAFTMYFSYSACTELFYTKNHVFFKGNDLIVYRTNC
jgi:hypothetical protein